MPALKVTVTVEQDGVALPGFPFVRRIQTSDVQAFAYTQDDTGVDAEDVQLYTTLPVIGEISPVRLLVLRTDAVAGVRFAGQTDAGVDLEAGGLVILVDCDITHATPVAIATAGATLSGVAAGT